LFVYVPALVDDEKEQLVFVNILLNVDVLAF